MGLRDIHFNREYRIDRVTEFLRPCINNCINYWRAVGFFSSTAFEAIGKPLGDFVENGGQIRLVTSVELNARDIDAIENGLRKKDVCDKRLIEQIKAESGKLHGSGAIILTKLLEMDRLEIRIAITPWDLQKIYHEKVGIFIETEDSYVSFSGSMNDSESGYENFGNAECVDVYPCWSDQLRAKDKKNYFEQLWQGEACGVETYEFPEAAKRELIRIKNNSRRIEGIEETPSKEILWEHQKKCN